MDTMEREFMECLNSFIQNINPVIDFDKVYDEDLYYDLIEQLCIYEKVFNETYALLFIQINSLVKQIDLFYQYSKINDAKCDEIHATIERIIQDMHVLIPSHLKEGLIYL
uniref:Uncharacterized protein n=1 Tax=viral metagenome TaxID=1070528 RepID=A0A6C0CSD4_9ZZZZ